MKCFILPLLVLSISAKCLATEECEKYNDALFTQQVDIIECQREQTIELTDKCLRQNEIFIKGMLQNCEDSEKRSAQLNIPDNKEVDQNDNE